ncbi:MULTISPECIES: copper chaperone PCu(A)C [Streptomyces]|uniref:copper chaperone PCu(A)C n=1 Tax=Streptomyces TaxID=1883 RepID=UPI002108CF37|nr:copper chaperone PCu(A)C [Streptomyces longispororuber]MCQ4210338.1 copper chaperone PCu(A)C [Streptomyces longispororuber]
MSSSLRRGALAAAAIAFSIASLAACGAGNNAQTLEVKPDNAATSVGDIKIQNATVITQPDRESKGPAVITGTLFNNGATAQTLDSITVDGVDKTAKLTDAKGGSTITVPAGGSVVLGGKGNASAELPNSRTAVLDGNAQAVTFSFSEAGDVKLKAFVVPAESYFQKWGPTEMPATPTATASPETSPTETATGAAGQQASGSATPGADASASSSASHAAAGH